jgi:3',5'-cyclic AMP phosphodiesterase CpdA
VTTVLQVSDPHFGTERAAVVQALLRFARALEPALLLVTGDVTQRATRAQFTAARAFVDRVSAPRTIVIPGNHDIPLFDLVARVWAPYRGLQRAFDAPLEAEFAADDVLVLALNTTRAWRHKDGDVSAAQIERVAARLAHASPAQVRIVAVHHPVAVTRPEDRTNRLHGATAALRRWAAAGADVVVGGHIHLPYTLALHERDAALPRRLWAVQAGTAVSARLRREAGNSVNVLRCDAADGARRCVVERWDYAAAHDAFVLKCSDVLQPDTGAASAAVARADA